VFNLQLFHETKPKTVHVFYSWASFSLNNPLSFHSVCITNTTLQILSFCRASILISYFKDHTYLFILPISQILSIVRFENIPSSRFRDVEGSLLVELKELQCAAPEFFYDTLRKELHLSLKQILRFSRPWKTSDSVLNGKQLN